MLHALQTTAMGVAEGKTDVLIVDPDIPGVEPLRLGLAESGLAARTIASKAAALQALKERPPQLVVIDWNLPHFGGQELIRAASAAGAPQRIGIIILSGLVGDYAVVDGLARGADDYIAKPFSLREAVARVQAVLRSRRKQPRRALACGDLILDAETNIATVLSNLIELSPVECRLLQFLMSHPGQAFNRTQLLTEVWGADTLVDERTVDVNVQRLRKLLSEPGCAGYIQTVRGFGYRLSAS